MKCRECGYKMIKNGTNRRISKKKGRYVVQNYLCKECGSCRVVRINK